MSILRIAFTPDTNLLAMLPGPTTTFAQKFEPATLQAQYVADPTADLFQNLDFTLIGTVHSGVLGTIMWSTKAASWSQPEPEYAASLAIPVLPMLPGICAVPEPSGIAVLLVMGIAIWKWRKQ